MSVSSRVLPQPSHHRRVLRGAGLVRSRRDGKMMMYAVTETGRALIDAGREPETAAG